VMNIEFNGKGVVVNKAVQTEGEINIEKASKKWKVKIKN